MDEHLAVFIPVGRVVNPYTHSNWEGRVVTQDVLVDSKGALTEAYSRALREAKTALPSVRRMRAQAAADLKRHLNVMFSI